MTFQNYLAFLFLFAITNPAFSFELQKGISDPVLRESIRQHNANTAQLMNGWSPTIMTAQRPFAEHEKAGYLIMSDQFNFNSRPAKRAMLENLPAGVQAIVYTGDNSQERAREIREEYKDVIAMERLHVVYIPGSSRGFWTRDGVPVPVLRLDEAPTPLRLIDAKYYHRFEGDQYFAELFGADLLAHSFYYEGGNFMPNSQAECLMVNNDLASNIPDSIFASHYGCKKLTRLPFVKGIGHMDESVRFVDDNRVLTDEPRYHAALRAAGYEIIEMPRPENYYETYINSLHINGTVFVPVFGQAGDEEALEIYRSLGWKTVPVPSSSLSNNGLGSIHCITMTYPEVPLKELLRALGAQQL